MKKKLIVKFLVCVHILILRFYKTQYMISFNFYTVW